MPLQESEKSLFAALEIKDPGERFETLQIKLLALTGNINCKNRYGKSLLMTCIERNDMDCLQLLLEVKADPNDKDVFDNTALMSAVDNGNITCAKLLIDASANINAISKKGYSALEIAMDKKDFNSIQLLLQKKVVIRSIHELVFLILDNKKVDFLNIMLDVYQNQHYLERIFEGAAHYGYIHIVKKLLSHVSEKVIKHAINLAAQNNFIEIIQELFPRVTLSKDKLQELFCLASQHGEADFVMTLLQAKVNVNQGDGFDTPLMFATKNGNPACVTTLLEARAFVNQKTKNGTALVVAAKNRDVVCMKLLLEAKANPDLAAPASSYDFFAEATTPLEYLASSGNTACVNLLLEYKTDLNHPKVSSAVTKAAKEGYVDLVKLLIDAKANLTKVQTDFAASLMDNFTQVKKQAECVSLIQNAMSDEVSQLKPVHF